MSNSVCSLQWTSLAKMAATETVVHGPHPLTSWAVGINMYYRQMLVTRPQSDVLKLVIFLISKHEMVLNTEMDRSKLSFLSLIHI